jgi:hypothetical protein
MSTTTRRQDDATSAPFCAVFFMWATQHTLSNQRPLDTITRLRHNYWTRELRKAINRIIYIPHNVWIRCATLRNIYSTNKQ